MSNRGPTYFPLGIQLTRLQLELMDVFILSLGISRFCTRTYIGLVGSLTVINNVPVALILTSAIINSMETVVCATMITVSP